MEAQGRDIEENILVQDNLSTVLLGKMVKNQAVSRQSTSG
jgi:hypothetical protein